MELSADDSIDSVSVEMNRARQACRLAPRASARGQDWSARRSIIAGVLRDVVSHPQRLPKVQMEHGASFALNPSQISPQMQRREWMTGVNRVPHPGTPTGKGHVDSTRRRLALSWWSDRLCSPGGMRLLEECHMLKHDAHTKPLPSSHGPPMTLFILSACVAREFSPFGCARPLCFASLARPPTIAPVVAAGCSWLSAFVSFVHLCLHPSHRT
jgi:hypothetical protein